MNKYHNDLNILYLFIYLLFFMSNIYIYIYIYIYSLIPYRLAVAFKRCWKTKV